MIIEAFLNNEKRYSENFMSSFNIKNDITVIENEVNFYSRRVVRFLEQNPKNCKKLQAEVDCIISSNYASFKLTKLGLVQDSLAALYFNIIIKSLLQGATSLNSDWSSRIEPLQSGGWVERNAFIYYITKNSLFITLSLNLQKNKVPNKVCRVLYHLIKRGLIVSKTVTSREGSNYQSNTFLRLQCSELVGTPQLIETMEATSFKFDEFNLSFAPFSEVSADYIVGGSINTIFSLYKQSKFQHKPSKLDLNGVKLLSQQPFVIPTNPIENDKYSKLLELEFSTIAGVSCVGSKSNWEPTILSLYNAKLRELSQLKNTVSILLKKNFKEHEYGTVSEVLKAIMEVRLELKLSSAQTSDNVKLLRLVKRLYKLIKNPAVSKKLCRGDLFIEQTGVIIKSAEVNGGLRHQSIVEKRIGAFLNITTAELIKEPYRLEYAEVRALYDQLWKTNNACEDIRKKYQKSIYLFTLVALNDIKQPVYFNHFRDWRGRIYSNSIAHPMYNAAVRPFLEIKSTKKDLLLESNYFKHIVAYKGQVFKILGRYLNNETDLRDIYYLLVVSIQLGNLMYQPTPQDYSISLGSLIENGLRCIKKNFKDEKWVDKEQIKKLSIEEKLYQLRLLDDANKFLHLGVWGNVTIIVDATASTLQCWSCILKPKSLGFLKKMNLSGDVKVDTYSWIIDLFIKWNRNELSTYKYATQILNRKYLKKSIMTSNYNVSERSSLKYFTEEICEDLSIEITQLCEFKAEVNLIHKKFYTFLNEELFVTLFGISRTEYIEKHPRFLKLNGEEIDLRYYSKSAKLSERAVRFSPTEKWKFTYSKLTDKINEQKTLTALPANLIHGVDANIVNYVINQMTVFPVHDCFIIPIQDIHYLMDILNVYYSEQKSIRGLNPRYSTVLIA